MSQDVRRGGLESPLPGLYPSDGRRRSWRVRHDRSRFPNTRPAGAQQDDAGWRLMPHYGTVVRRLSRMANLVLLCLRTPHFDRYARQHSSRLGVFTPVPPKPIGSCRVRFTKPGPNAGDSLLAQCIIAASERFGHPKTPFLTPTRGALAASGNRTLMCGRFASHVNGAESANDMPRETIHTRGRCTVTRTR